MTVRIVIPGDDPAQIQGSPHLERLRAKGEVALHLDRPKTMDEQVERAKHATCIINTRGVVKWPREALLQLPDLKMITVCGIGTDSIDLATAKERGIVVCNIPGKTAPTVAEHAFALMFAVARRVTFHQAALKQGRWSTMQNISLRGKTLGIIGTGNIGIEMVRLAKAFGMDVIAWTFNPNPELAKANGFTYTSFDEVLSRSDVVSLHVKLTDATRGLIDAKALASMKHGAILVNTARGAVVDTNALVEELNSGRLGGAGLDVFDVEPLPATHPLLACDQVVLTPHNADQTPEAIDLLNSWCVDNVLAFLAGKPVHRVA